MKIMSSARTGAPLLMLIGALVGCSSMFASTNDKVAPAAADGAQIAPAAGPGYPIYSGNPGCFERPGPWGDRIDHILALTLSGGGSRAAVFGAAVMLELQDVGALDSVDLISSVSGGSLPAAMYGLSRAPDEAQTANEPNRIVWDRATVINMTEQDLIAPWLWRWFRPDNFGKFWFTAYDRTDIFADAVDAKVFRGLGDHGGYPTYADLNYRRPIISQCHELHRRSRLDVFTFTPWQFKETLNSDLCSYDVARAVAASAAFPGVMQYETLSHFTSSGHPDGYVHLMDGGATDNLGLKGLNQAMETLHLCGQGDRQSGPQHRCGKVLVLVVDAQNGFEGRDPAQADPRGLFGHFFDTNFLDAYDTLMQTGYGQLLHQFRGDIEEHDGGQAAGAGVLHLSLLTLINNNAGQQRPQNARTWLGYDAQYEAPTTCPGNPPAPPAGPGDTEQAAVARACALAKTALAQVAGMPEFVVKLRGIPTDWRIQPDQAACLEVAAYALVAAARPELEKFFAGEKVLKPHDADRFAHDRSACLEPRGASS
jgi:NTE family protein